MIRTEHEYRRSLERIAEVERGLEAQRQQFLDSGVPGDEVQILLDPAEAILSQMQAEAETFRQMQAGQLGTLCSLADIGRWLIGVRIARRLSQKQLADLLGVTEAQVSRDERNEYHGISVDRAQSLLERMGVRYRIEEVLGGDQLSTAIVSSRERVSPTGAQMPSPNLPFQVGAHLRADRNLAPEQAEKLADLFTRLYDSYAATESSQENRAAGTEKP